MSYLSNGGEPNPDGIGGGSPSYFASRRKLMINSNFSSYTYFRKSP
ncbi:hypothetical protein [Clostridium sp. YIM B02555]|nr:hypothetical protein [Clostridium sp. YIM B02555]